MKKIMSLLLVGIMMLSLVACGKDGGKNGGELNVGVFYYTYSDTYISSVRTALDNALTEAGIKFQNYDGNSNQTTQNEQIDTAIAQGTNLLIVNIVTSGSVDASQAIVDKASAAGIPVIFFNRAVESDEDEGKVLGSYDKCAFVGTDAPEAGHMQGKIDVYKRQPPDSDRIFVFWEGVLICMASMAHAVSFSMDLSLR